MLTEIALAHACVYNLLEKEIKKENKKNKDSLPYRRFLSSFLVGKRVIVKSIFAYNI